MSLEVVKIRDEGLGRKFPILSSESFGKGEARRRAKCPRGLRTSYLTICNRMDETFEGRLERKVVKKHSNWPLVPLKSSWRALLGIIGSIKASMAESES